MTSSGSPVKPRSKWVLKTTIILWRGDFIVELYLRLLRANKDVTPASCRQAGRHRGCRQDAGVTHYLSIAGGITTSHQPPATSHQPLASAELPRNQACVIARSDGLQVDAILHENLRLVYAGLVPVYKLG